MSIISISALITAADSDQNFLSGDTFASFDSLFEMRRFACSTALTLVSNFAISQLPLLSVLLLVFFTVMLHDVLRFPPYYNQLANLCSGAAGASRAAAPPARSSPLPQSVSVPPPPRVFLWWQGFWSASF